MVFHLTIVYFLDSFCIPILVLFREQYTASQKKEAIDSWQLGPCTFQGVNAFNWAGRNLLCTVGWNPTQLHGCWTKNRGKTPQIIHLFIGLEPFFSPSILKVKSPISPIFGSTPTWGIFGNDFSPSTKKEGFFKDPGTWNLEQKKQESSIRMSWFMSGFGGFEGCSIQWIFQVPWHSPSPNWQEKYHLYTTYSPCLLGGPICYQDHLLWEPETTIDQLKFLGLFP